MTVRTLSFACGATDRMAALADGRVRPVGIDLTTMLLPVEEIFHRAIRHHEFDVAELSLSSYAMLLERGAPYVALPAFPSRAFRHNGVWVHERAGIDRPADLVGKVVGVPEYQMTAAVWIRGILDEYHGVPPASVSYRTGGLFSAGREEKIPIAPPGIDLRPISEGSLSEALMTGAIDALYSPYPPAGALEEGAPVRRLWPDFRAEETRYFEATGIFPIMHVVAVRRDVYERDRWVARSLLTALERSKDLAIAAIREGGSLGVALPFAFDEARRTRLLFGSDYWPYGVERNRAALEALLRYSHEQGLTAVRHDVAELFAPETLDTHVV